MSNLIRGCLTNGIGLAILLPLSFYLELQLFAYIALGIQYFVYLVHGLPFNSEKYYDCSGSLTHLALFLTSMMTSETITRRQIVNTFFGVIWLTRLGSFLFTRILSDKLDTRFTEIKTSGIRFLGVWTLQAVWVFLIDLPIVIINQNGGTQPLMYLDYIAFFVWVVGFFFEAVADAQKSAFKADLNNKGKFIDEGLWSISRHPNYFGEILMWLAVALSCMNQYTEDKQQFGWISPVFTIFLLLKVSGIPMLEQASDKRWGLEKEYIEYKKRTPVLIPFLK